MTLPIPDIKLPSIYFLTPQMLKNRNISLLLLDLDNTLAPYSARGPNKELSHWVQTMIDAGIKLFILSNNKGERPKVFGKALSVPNLNRAEKPKTDVLFKVLAEYNTAPENAAIMGDQIFTDVLCGVRGGLTTVVVKPLSMKNPFFLLRYIAELPFRQKGRNTEN